MAFGEPFGTSRELEASGCIPLSWEPILLLPADKRTVSCSNIFTTIFCLEAAIISPSPLPIVSELGLWDLKFRPSGFLSWSLIWSKIFSTLNNEPVPLETFHPIPSQSYSNLPEAGWMAWPADFLLSWPAIGHLTRTLMSIRRES